MVAWQRCLEGTPQAVVILGEPQLGKTRIVQEFFARLSATEDPEGYWPAELKREGDQLHLAPSFASGTEVTSACPWLWWAVQWRIPKVRNPGVVDQCAVLASASYLRPHVEAAQRWRACKAAEKSAAIGAGKTLLNLATLGSAGTAIEIFERFQDWWAVRQAASDAESSIADRSRQAAGSQLDDLRELLGIFCLSPAVHESGVPLILVLDDVQWADADSLGFIEQLLAAVQRAAAAGKRRPRVLIVATSWEREWNAADATAGGSVGSASGTQTGGAATLAARCCGRPKAPRHLP